VLDTLDMNIMKIRSLNVLTIQN